MLTYDQLLKENSKLRALAEEQKALIAELGATVQRQVALIEQLQQEVEKLKRRGKRQAAPFSKGSPKAKPKKPGRKRGKEHGGTSQRPVPKEADETIRVACPPYCPHCAAQLRLACDSASHDRVRSRDRALPGVRSPSAGPPPASGFRCLDDRSRALRSECDRPGCASEQDLRYVLRQDRCAAGKLDGFSSQPFELVPRLGSVAR